VSSWEYGVLRCLPEELLGQQPVEGTYNIEVRTTSIISRHMLGTRSVVQDTLIQNKEKKCRHEWHSSSGWPVPDRELPSKP